jgi:hypothetical protein
VVSTEDFVPSLPLKIVSLGQRGIGRNRRTSISGKLFPMGWRYWKGANIHMFSCRPSWRESITVFVGGQFYELAKLGASDTNRPFAYLGRRHPLGEVIRGLRYRQENIRIVNTTWQDVPLCALRYSRLTPSPPAASQEIPPR